MNKIIGIILFAVYLLYIGRILIPFIDYSLNYSYIISELCIERESDENNCHGSCHLSKEIQKQAESSSNQKQAVQFNFIKSPHQALSLFKLEKPKKENKIELNSKMVNIINRKLEPTIPPPKVVS